MAQKPKRIPSGKSSDDLKLKKLLKQLRDANLSPGQRHKL